jgi:hypothetical protein
MWNFEFSSTTFIKTWHENAKLFERFYESLTWYCQVCCDIFVIHVSNFIFQLKKAMKVGKYSIHAHENFEFNFDLNEFLFQDSNY